MFKLIAKNSSIQLGGRFASSFLSFLTTFFLARILGPSFYGEYAKITAYLMLWYLMVDFGINAFFIKATKANSSSLAVQFPKLLGLRLVLSTLISVLAVMGALLLSQSGSGFTALVVTGVFIGFSTIIAYSVQLSAMAVFQARLTFFVSQLAQMLGPLITVTLFLIATLFYSGSTLLYGALVSLVIGSWVTSLFSLWFIRNAARLVPAFDLSYSQKILRDALPFGLVLVLNILYFRIDMLILGKFRDSAEIGAYALAYKFFEFAIAIPAFVMNSLYPILVSRSLREQQRLLFWYGLLLGVFALCVTAVMWFMAPLITLVRIEYAPSIVYLRVLSLWLLFFFISAPLMWWHILRGYQVRLLLPYVLGVLVNVYLNALYIPISGALAASVITGITELVVIVVSFIQILILESRRRTSP